MAAKPQKTDAIEFLAYLPPIQTALTMSGDGDLMRIKMDCNLSISPNALRLLGMTGKQLKVTVEESLTNFDDKGKQGTPHETTKSAEGSRPKMDRRRRTNRRDKR